MLENKPNFPLLNNRHSSLSKTIFQSPIIVEPSINLESPIIFEYPIIVEPSTNLESSLQLSNVLVHVTNWYAITLCYRLQRYDTKRRATLSLIILAGDPNTHYKVLNSRISILCNGTG